MKKLSMFLLGCIVLLPAFSQVNKNHQGIRVGDEIIKQQVEYQSPGEPGANKVWDFSRLKTVNDRYSITYSLPPLEGDSVYILGNTRIQKKEIEQNELIVGTEHHTMYFYRLRSDSLLQLGHENPSIEFEYTIPLHVMNYPFNYGQSISSAYKAKGLYSGSVHVETNGDINTTADAFGKMILPTGDTLNPVLRVKTIQTIIDIPNEYSINPTGKEDMGRSLETCRWYTKGYRYPVFETIRSASLADDTEVFSTAFFYPLQDHYYLSTDPENQALLDEMWDMENKQTVANIESTANETQEIIEINKIYPNPVTTEFTVEYTLKQKEKVQIVLVSSEGNVVRNIQKNTQDTGFHQETITCQGLMYGIYHLKLIAGNQTINQTIIKN
jgi:hypothetical protein